MTIITIAISIPNNLFGSGFPSNSSKTIKITINRIAKLRSPTNTSSLEDNPVFSESLAGELVVKLNDVFTHPNVRLALSVTFTYH